jgi:hypothetical protein
MMGLGGWKGVGVVLWIATRQETLFLSAKLGGLEEVELQCDEAQDLIDRSGAPNRWTSKQLSCF